MDDPEIGDVVRLRSGGPAMTIYAEAEAPVDFGGGVMVGEAGYVCRWFVQGAMKEATFKAVVLDRVNAPAAQVDRPASAGGSAGDTLPFPSKQDHLTNR